MQPQSALTRDGKGLVIVMAMAIATILAPRPALQNARIFAIDSACDFRSKAPATRNRFGPMTSSTPPDIDVAIVGAGVIGLAIAAALARGDREVLVLERNHAIGQETSARNSEVIHAGLYYQPGSLKARLCVDGRKRLYRFADENAIPYRRTGKLLVATNAQEERVLADIAVRAAANGVTDAEPLTASGASALEPALACTAALLSPSTGILDSHAYMQALEGHLTSHDGSVVLNTRVSTISLESNGLFTLNCHDRANHTADREYRLTARSVVAAAGHGMPDLAATLPSTAAYAPPQTCLAKGHYFTLRQKAPFKHLIYPVPADAGLGIHVTLDLNGQARFGPDVTWVDDIDYHFEDADGARRRRFASAIRRYWPDLDATTLDPGYTGIRPKLSRPGEPAADFAIDGPAQHGIANLVSLFGIESPGLTASLAIAEYVANMLRL